MVYPSFRHEDLIIDWFKRSQNEETRGFTVFDKFISLWFAFNSWGTYSTKKAKDWQMLNAVKKEPRLLTSYGKSITEDPEFLKAVKRLAEYKVLDMRPGHETESRSIDDIGNFGQILDVIYLIRCNLFHGRKSEIDAHDKELVELAYHILSRVFRPIIDELARGLSC